MERYRSLAATGELFTAAEALFERDRFFDWRPEDTSVRLSGGKYHNLYESLREKYDQAIYHGDKGPHYYARANNLLQAFPGAKMIIIWRAIEEVAMSWQRRSVDQSSWPAENDASAALGQASQMFETILRVKTKFPRSVKLVEYDQVFKQGDPTPLRIADWLELDRTDAAYRNTIRSLRLKARNLDKRREPILGDVLDHVSSNDELHELTSRLHGLSR